MYRLDVQYSNNQVEYEALIISLKLLKSLDVTIVQIMGDSQLVINRLLGEYKCNSLILEEYLEEAKGSLEHFDNVIISHIPKTFNEEANDLAQHASGCKHSILDVNTIEKGSVLTISHQSRTSTD